MGKKKWAYKTSKAKSSPPPREEDTEEPIVGEQPANQPPPPEELPKMAPAEEPPVNEPPPILQPGTMISAEALTEYLKAQNPGVDWKTALAGSTQVVGAAATTENAEGEEADKRGAEGDATEKVEKHTAETSTRAEATKGVDLNELAKKQGLTTDDEFQTMIDGGKKMEENAAKMAEGLDLASEAVGDWECYFLDLPTRLDAFQIRCIISVPEL